MSSMSSSLGVWPVRKENKKGEFLRKSEKKKKKRGRGLEHFR